MKKLLTLLLLITSSLAYSNTIGISGLEKPFASRDLIGYDLHIEFDLTKYVEGFGISGNQTENNKTYYQDRDLEPTEDFMFSIKLLPLTSINQQFAN